MVIDDSAVVRETLSHILNSDPDIEVIATAADPVFAAKKLESINPDVLTLDVEMPRMDGLTFLRKLMASRPMPVIVCSSKVESGSENALQALDYGAVELVLKPKVGTKTFIEESQVMFCDIVKAAYSTKVRTYRPRMPYGGLAAVSADAVLAGNDGSDTVNIETTEKIVVVGASTGGTEALREMFEMMPADGPGVVAVLHMPEFFTTSFAARLDSVCRMSVREARDGDAVTRGVILIAPGNKHTLLQRNGAYYSVQIKDGPLVTRHRPSVDVLFRSAARYAGKNAVGIIMTGMGDDGARGMHEMKQAGAYNIAQDEKSCVVFGMPNEAIKLGGVDKVLPLKKIAEEVLRVTH
ncbi:MAG: protein-glutamate methylesterase/protein-glutamine glutaminase [Spirochaetia bacterium]